MKEKPRLLIADDHAIFAEGLRRILEPRFEIVAIVADGHAMVKKAIECAPDLVLADISMPLLNGIDAARQIIKERPDSRILFLTMHPDIAYAIEAFNGGALGYVLKHAVTSELLVAIDKVLAREHYISPPLDERLESMLADARMGRRRLARPKLTLRRKQVLQLIAEGRSGREIAEILSISPKTVDFHKAGLKTELGVATTAELVQQAVSLGLVHPHGGALTRPGPPEPADADLEPRPRGLASRP